MFESEVKEVKRFNTSAHVLISRKYLGQKVRITVLKETKPSIITQFFRKLLKKP